MAAAATAAREGFEDDLVRQLAVRGYAQLDSLLGDARVSRLADVARAVREAGWPPVFSFAFDDFWAPAWGPPLRTVAEAALHGPVRLIPHLAVHYVAESGERRGWHPHVDGRRRARRLTTWVPLTDATLANGCMYVVPKTDDESVTRAVERYLNRKMSLRDVQLLLQHARALPVPAGTVLCWGFDLLHWGSVNRESPAPRVSVAYEWIAETEPPRENEEPLLDLDAALPSFEERLRFIARAVCTYEGFDSALSPFRQLA